MLNGEGATWNAASRDIILNGDLKLDKDMDSSRCRTNHTAAKVTVEGKPGEAQPREVLPSSKDGTTRQMVLLWLRQLGVDLLLHDQAMPGSRLVPLMLNATHFREQCTIKQVLSRHNGKSRVPVCVSECSFAPMM